jgi:hypothetical protein
MLAEQAAQRALASVRLSELLKRRDALALLQVFCLSDNLARLVGGLFRLLAVENRVKCFSSEVTQLIFLIVILSIVFFEDQKIRGVFYQLENPEFKQNYNKRALSIVVRNLVVVLLELGILELVKEATDLLVDGIFQYIDICGDLLQKTLILSHALSLRLKFLVEFVELVLESVESLLELRSQHVESLAVPLALRGLLGNVFPRLIDAGLEQLELLGVRGRQLVIRLGLGARHSRVGGCISRFRNLLRELFPDRARGLLGRDLRLALPVGFLGQRVLALADAHGGWLREPVEFRRSLQRIQLRGELAQVRHDVRQLRQLVCGVRSLRGQRRMAPVVGCQYRSSGNLPSSAARIGSVSSSP